MAEPKQQDKDGSEGSAPFERFQDLTQKLLSVPKKEAEQQREDKHREQPK